MCVYVSCFKSPVCGDGWSEVGGFKAADAARTVNVAALVFWGVRYVAKMERSEDYRAFFFLIAPSPGRS